MKKKRLIQKPDPTQILLRDLRELITSARQAVAQAVNSTLVMLYWSVSQRIRQDILKGKRATYGEEISPTPSAKLVPEFGDGYGVRNLARMIRFAEVFPDIVLLFYNRKLRRLVAIDLKLEEFKPADKGQMELYLRWLEKYEQQPGEESPIGLILCAGKSEEQIELLQLDKSGIRVASYFTELPPRELLQKKLHEAIVLARARLEHGQLPVSAGSKK
jgi:hypothetical protein